MGEDVGRRCQHKPSSHESAPLINNHRHSNGRPCKDHNRPVDSEKKNVGKNKKTGAFKSPRQPELSSQTTRVAPLCGGGKFSWLRVGVAGCLCRSAPRTQNSIKPTIAPCGPSTVCRARSRADWHCAWIACCAGVHHRSRHRAPPLPPEFPCAAWFHYHHHGEPE